MRRIFIVSAMLVLFLAHPAYAVQEHGDPEGLIVHQLSHLFYAFSMGLLIYWLRKRGLHSQPGWRAIQYSAVFFILWTFDAFFAHLIDEHLSLVSIKKAGRWSIDITSPSIFLTYFYYLVKLDHILCVPGIILLYSGLKRLSGEKTA